MSGTLCKACSKLRYLVDRNRQLGKPSNLRFRACDECRARRREYEATLPKRVRKPGKSNPTPRQELDELEAEMLANGEISGSSCRRIERREAIRILFKRRPDLNYRQIAERVGTSVRTVERVRKTL